MRPSTAGCRIEYAQVIVRQLAGGVGPSATPHGVFPTGMRFTTLIFAVSITLTSFEGPFAL
jgi:hypothetical protein